MTEFAFKFCRYYMNVADVEILKVSYLSENKRSGTEPGPPEGEHNQWRNTGTA